MTITIQNIGGKWRINGKLYSELSFEEKSYFETFLRETKLESLVKQ